MTTDSATMSLSELTDKIGKIRFAMFATRSQAQTRAVPMTVIKADEDGTLWFLGARGSAVVDDVAADPEITLSFADSNEGTFAFVHARAEMRDDKDKIKELWNPVLNAWFDGADDPAIQLLRVTIESAEYWDSPSSKVVRVLSMVRAAVTGDDNSTGEHGQIDNPRASVG